MNDVQVLIAGAGSVGLMLANLLGKAGVKVLLVEKKIQVQDSSKAIGISPPSLEIFNRIGLADSLAQQGRRVKTVRISGSRRALGSLDFSGLATEYPYILAVPQGRTESLLDSHLAGFPSVQVLRGWEVLSLESGASAADPFAALTLRSVADGAQRVVRADYVCACDGGASLIREAAGFSWHGSPYRDTFLMGDFIDKTGWGDEARLFFTSRGSVESFPLPEGLRRYVLSTPRFIKEGSGQYLREEVPLRSGVSLADCEQKWESAFGVQRYLARTYRQGRILLCGDAAHLMSPIVGQNMNTGFGDAEFLAAIMPRILANSDSAARWLSLYRSRRKKAAKSAADRAWFMMRLGTSSGRFWSPLRSALVFFALHTPLKRILPKIFSMVSIPFVNLTKKDVPLV